jgi:protein-tyrosine phosphatase
VIDLHCHVLAGIDDGPARIEDSVALARAAAATGIETIVATPHVSARYPNRSEEIVRLVEELAERLSSEGVAVAVEPGAEVAMSHVQEVEPDQLARLRLGGGPWLLLEPPFTPIATGIDRTIAVLHEQGHRVVLAHPERCPAFQRDPELLRALVDDGVLASLTAGSLVGRFGKAVRGFATRLLTEGLAHSVASDAHDCDRRPTGMAAELRRAGQAELVDWLTVAVPTAILAGEEIPPRPTAPAAARASHRRLWRR